MPARKKSPDSAPLFAVAAPNPPFKLTVTVLTSTHEILASYATYLSHRQGRDVSLAEVVDRLTLELPKDPAFRAFEKEARP